MQIRGYQTDLLRRTHAALLEHQWVCMQLATGAGKTVIAGEMARSLARTADRQIIALYLIHRKELADQAHETLTDFGLGDMIGRIEPRHPENRYKPFQIASIPSLVRRLDRLPWLDPLIVIVDEAHHVRARTWERVLDRFPHAYRVGMTATPARLDGKGLGKYFRTLVLGPDIAELTADGWLAPLDLYAPKLGLDLKALRRMRSEAAMLSAADGLFEGPVIAKTVENWQRLAGDQRTLYYAVTVRHSEEVVAAIRAAGVNAEHVDGSMDGRRRGQIFRRFKSGITQFVSNVDIATEGFDCPACGCVVLGRPTSSTTLYRQMVGRAMRPKPDGAHGVLVDLAGNLEEHGPPDDYIGWSLADGVIEAREKGERPKHRRCPECDGIYAIGPPACPYCGYMGDTKTAAEVDVDVVSWGTTGKQPPSAKVQERDLARRVMDTGGDPAALDAIRREYGVSVERLQQWKVLYAPIWNTRRRA